MQHKNLSQGDKIGIKVPTGEILQKIVWEPREKCVLVCSKRQYEWLKKGDFRAAPIGFRWDDVQFV